MIYVDIGTVPLDHPTAPRCFLGRQFGHLMADSEEELISYARSIGLKVGWIQKKGDPVYVHFDVTGRFLSHVLKDPTVKRLSSREMCAMLIERRRVQNANSSETTR